MRANPLPALFGVLALVLFPACMQDDYAYQDSSLPVEKRVKDLMGRMSVEEKVAQVSAQLLFGDEFYEKRDYSAGHVRNVGHFMAHATPSAVAEAINADTQKSCRLMLLRQLLHR